MKRRCVSAIALVLAFLGGAAAQTVPDPKDLIPHGDQRLFLSGMNLAWMNFGRDLEIFDELKFTRKVNDIAYNGGNAMRWWLFVNGAASPTFGPDGKVSGIPEEHVRVVKRALDIAAERGVGLILSLWSFDMLQDGVGPDLGRNVNLLTKKAHTQAWIDNALVPLVKAVGRHPGLIAWEICNEPEGMAENFGWTRRQVSMDKILAFVNRNAGAIRRAVPGVLVTNGSWNIQVLTDEQNLLNYYSDERLIAAGGDPDGILDFYQVHYYPQHFTDELSPFHNPKSFWKLDKPLLIGEFPSKGVVPIPAKGDFKAGKSLTTEEAYRFALEQGYAGVLSWTMTNHDGFGGFNSSQDAMANLAEAYPDSIAIDTSKIVRGPRLSQTIREPQIALGKTDWGTILDLAQYFSDPDEGARLSFSLLKNSSPEIAELALSPEGLLTGKPGPKPAVSSFPVTVRCRNPGGAAVETSFLVHIMDFDRGNVALLKPASSSSDESDDYLASNAVDGNPRSRWSTKYRDEQWLAIDLQGAFALSKAVLFWEAAFGGAYDVEASKDGRIWTTLASKDDGEGGTEEIPLSGVWNFVRLNLKERGTQWGFSLWDVEIHGERVKR